MQLTSFILPLAFSTATTALPSNYDTTTTDTPPVLEKREAYGWITNYNWNDTSCKERLDGMYEMIGARPKLYIGVCTKFSPQTDQIGLDWGAGDYSFNSLNVYKSADCKDEQATVKNIKKTAGDCFRLEDLTCVEKKDGLCSVGSVMAVQ